MRWEPKFLEVELDLSCSRVFFLVNLRQKAVSHEAHQDALWMITANWSMKVHYSYLDLETRLKLVGISCAKNGCNNTFRIFCSKSVFPFFFFLLLGLFISWFPIFIMIADWRLGKLGAPLWRQTIFIAWHWLKHFDTLIKAVGSIYELFY